MNPTPLRSLALCSLLALFAPEAAIAQVLAPNFQETKVLSGLTEPTAVRFASDGRIFVAEQDAKVKVLDGLEDPSPDLLIDLDPEVMTFWDRGLLGLAVHPNFAANPYVYVLYTHDKPPGGTPASWNDACPAPPNGPGATKSGCVVNGRLSRFQVGAGNVQVGSEVVLLEGFWCQQFPSHSVGDLTFGADGALYVSAGEGANFNVVDRGHLGTTPNVCGDPLDEGGAFRSQDLTTPGDPVSYSGAILRLDPMTGNAMPDNPLIGGDPTDDRIVAFGLRNPYRMAARPGTHELWVGDVGWNVYEEVNRIQSATDGSIENFGWPCFEGPVKQGGYQNEAMCQKIYNNTVDTKTLTDPYYAYTHTNPPDAAACGGLNGSTGSITGMAFYKTGNYPSKYDGALLFADYARKCIWAMLPGHNGLPNPNNIVTLVSGAGDPVGLEIGPNGDLFYVDMGQGTVRRIRYFKTNQPPLARITVDHSSGLAPLSVVFDASTSSDADVGDTLSYAWDLDDDGSFDDGTQQTVGFAFGPGNHSVSLRVTDSAGASGDASITISAGNSAPVAKILTPHSTFTWAVGDAVSFSGSGSDEQEGTLPASSMEWTLVVQHCPGDVCHAHAVESFNGIADGQFEAPDHDHPSHLELRLKVTDAQGLTAEDSVHFYPKTVKLTLESAPSGLQLTLNAATLVTPFTQTVIVGSLNSLSVPLDQTFEGRPAAFREWTDGAPPAREIRAPLTDTSYSALFDVEPPPVFPEGGPTVLGVPDETSPLEDDAPSLEPSSAVGCGCAQAVGTLPEVLAMAFVLLLLTHLRPRRTRAMLSS